MKFTRRDVIRTTAAAAAGVVGSRFLGTPAFAQDRTDLHARGRRDAEIAALVALRPGRRGPVAREHQAFYRRDRRAGSRRQGKLGGYPSESRGRRQCRFRPGPDARLVRRCASVSGQAARRERPRRISRQQVWRLVRRTEGLCHTRGQVHRPAAGDDRQRHRLSRQLGQGSRLLRIPEGYGGLPRTLQGDAEDRPSGGLHAWPWRRRRQQLRALAACGAMAARWSTRAARSSSTAPRR